MKLTKNQREQRDSCKDPESNYFKCPSCLTEWIGTPLIWNPGEDKTQIFCNYVCGYLYIEDFKNRK